MGFAGMAMTAGGEDERGRCFDVLCQHDVDEVRRTLKFYLEAIDAAMILHVEPTAEGIAARLRALRLKEELVRSYGALVRRVQASAARRYAKVLASKPGKSTQKTPQTMLLDLWFTEHVDVPYPSQEEKEAFASLCGMNTKQIATWFTNRRARFKKKALAKAEQKQHPNDDDDDDDDTYDKVQEGEEEEPSMKQARPSSSSTEDDADGSMLDLFAPLFQSTSSLDQLVLWPRQEEATTTPASSQE